MTSSRSSHFHPSSLGGFASPFRKSEAGIRNTMLVLRFLHDLEQKLDAMNSDESLGGSFKPNFPALRKSIMDVVMDINARLFKVEVIDDVYHPIPMKFICSVFPCVDALGA